jgi:hypothetical protein
MESRTVWEAENRRIGELIRRSALRVASTTEAGPPSPYGRYVDSVAQRGYLLGMLAEHARFETMITTLKARLIAGHPDIPPLPQAGTMSPKLAESEIPDGRLP